ncbi:Para-aminobenzoate synthase, amidotransferase component [Klebsiella pneumoniae]|uniref:Para-aminobenzoate synthase, amidotransferase component n=1 Tax=Klebsiella pneumoniae TaxID=573 RepID=A0A2X3D7Z6_KLEPN|nr:Para-aminobenzoate synthase, amidotransferase component [Klebsiella pneumoniae]
MILLIDNYDSFTWNLYQYFCELGAEVLVRRNDALTLEEIAALAPEKIVISPGPCTRMRRGFPSRLSATMRGKRRCWASVSGTRRSPRRLARLSCGRPR